MILPTPSSRVDNDLARRFWASTWLPAHGHFPELQIHMDMGLLGRIAGMSPLLSSSYPSPSFHGPALVVQVHRRVPLDLDLIYPLSIHAAHQGRMTRPWPPCPSTPPPPPPMLCGSRWCRCRWHPAWVRTCPGAARPRFWAPRDQGRPRGLLQVRDLMVCVSAPGPSGWIHIDPAVMQQQQ